jgi:hypothetical protein
MAGDKPDVLLVGAKKPVMMKGFEGKVTLHHWLDAKDTAAFVKEVGDKIKAIAIAYTANKVDGNFGNSPTSSRFQALASATIILTQNGQASMASSSPTRPKC